MGIALLTTFSVATRAADKNQSFSPAQVKQIEQITHDYLVKNPQVLVEAAKSLQSQQEEQMQTAAMQGIKENKNQLFNNKLTPTTGNANAAVSVVEFFDYQCGHCKQMASAVKKLESNKNVNVIFKELPIFGGMSQVAAEAALASEKQGKFVAFHNALFDVQGPLNKDSIFDTAKKVGLNVDQLKKDMNSADVKNQIQQNFQLAQNLKLMGTPAFVLTNKAQTQFEFVPGATSLDNLNVLIKKLQ